MHKNPDHQIRSTIDTVSAALKKTFATSGTTFEQQLKGARRHLPRNIRKSAQSLAEAEKKFKYLPYVPQSTARQLEKDGNRVSSYIRSLDIKSDKKAARRRWFFGLALNYAIFLLMLAAFWYIATQM